MTIAQYKDRETQGAKQDLNMLRFQQMPMVPANYRKSEMILRPLAKTFIRDETDNLTLREQQKRDKMAANSRRTSLNIADRLTKILSTVVKFDIMTAAKISGVSYDTAKTNVRKWIKDGLIVDTGEASLRGSALFAKVGYQVKTVEFQGSGDAKRGRAFSVQRCNSIFGDAIELTSLQIKEITGCNKSATCNMIKGWESHGLVEFVGFTGDTGRLKLWRKK